MLSRPRRASASHPINYSEASYTPGPLTICPSYHTPSSSTSTALVVRRPKAAARTGGKTFQCVGYGECEMKFTRSEHLARHIRKHTGEKPFVCHCSKAFSRIDNLRQHCASVHSNLVKLNEVTIRALMPVHSALSQQAGRDNQAYVRYIGTKSPKPTLRLTDRRISSMRGTRSITPPALYSLPPTPVSAMAHNKNVRIQEYEESTPGGTYASPMGYPGHNDSELKYRPITWRGNDSMIPSIIRHGFQTPVSAGSAALRELSKECTEGDEEEEENREGGRVYSYESEDSSSSHSDDAEGTNPTSASSSKMDPKQNVAYQENPALLPASQVRPRHPPFLQQRSYSSPDIFSSVSGASDYHAAPVPHPVQQQHRHSIAQCTPDNQDHRYVQGTHGHVSHSAEDTHNSALSQYAGLGQGPQGGYNLYRPDTTSHVKTGFPHKAEPSRDNSRQVAEDYQSYDFGHSYNYAPDFHQGNQPGVSDSPHVFGDQGLWGFPHGTNNVHQTSVSADQYIHPNHSLHPSQHYQLQQHTNTAWRSNTAMAPTPWGRDHGRTRMNQVQPSYAPHTSAGIIAPTTNSANGSQPSSTAGYYSQPSIYTGPRHPPSKSKNLAMARPEPGPGHHPLHASSNQGSLSSAAGFPSYQPNRNLTMVPSTTLSSLYSPPFPILRTLSPTNHESGPRASASEEQSSAISGKKRSVSPPDGGHYTLENEGYTYGDEDGHSGSNGNKRLRLFSEAVEIDNSSYHLANYPNQDDQTSHSNSTQANLDIVSSTNSTGNTVPTFNPTSSHAPPEEAPSSSGETVANDPNPSAMPDASERSSNHGPHDESALSQVEEVKTDGLVVSLSDLANSVFVKQEIEDRFPEEEEAWAVITSNEDTNRESNQEHFQSGHTDMSDFLGDSFK